MVLLLGGELVSAASANYEADEEAYFASVELVLVQSQIFSRVPSTSTTANNSSATITLAGLSHLRLNPESLARNLELCESVDTAETELHDLRNCILVESTPARCRSKQKWDDLMMRELAARLRKINTRLLVGSSTKSDSSLALVGQVELHSPVDVDGVVLPALKLGGGGKAPVLFSLARNFTLDDLAVLLRVVVAQESGRVLMFTGDVLWVEGAALAREVLASFPPSCLLVVAAKGYGLDCELEDCLLAERVAELLPGAASRLVLGVNFMHALQLQRWGGSGYALAVRRLVQRVRHRLVAAAASAADNVDAMMGMLCKHNALRVLRYREYVPVVHVPEPVQEYTCHTCGKTQPLVVDDYFESHGKRFCTARCMREFRLLLSVNNNNNNSQDGFRQTNNNNASSSSAAAGWHVQL